LVAEFQVTEQNFKSLSHNQSTFHFQICRRDRTSTMTLASFWLSFVILATANISHGFSFQLDSRTTRVQSTQPQLSMTLGMKGKDSGEVKLPRDVKDAVSSCRAAVQVALKNQISRMDIEFPVGTKFGVEKGDKKKAKNDGGPTKSILDQSDRELARLFVEMFQPVGGDNICVAFNDQGLADLANKQWDLGFQSRVLAMNRNKGVKKEGKAKPKGFAAKMAAEVEDTEGSGGPFKLPEGTEVVLFVAPGPKELVVIEKICADVGMGTLVVLLNARMSKITNFGTEEAEKLFTQDFEKVFCLSAAPQNAAPDCLLYRTFPDDWVLARKPKVGQPKPLLTRKEIPTADECKKAYENIDVGGLEKGVESALENVAGWFR
jgi:hypothetical protein